MNNGMRFAVTRLRAGIRTLLATGAALCVLLVPMVQASDLTSLTDLEREALRAEVRQLLVTNPEIVLEALEELQRRDAAAQSRDDSDLVAQFESDLFNDTHSWVGGNLDGDITLVEFLDYSCGFCRKSFEVVNELLETDGNIRFVVKEFPILGPDSEVASAIAVAVLQLAGADPYKTSHDRLIQYHGPYDDSLFHEIADLAGLEPDALAAQAADPATWDIINDNYWLANQLGIDATPTFIIGNTLFRGHLPLAEMQAIVEQERTRRN